MGVEAPSYRGFRFPAEIISHCVWLYHRFPLSLREVQEMMLARGVIVSHETIRQWCATFGQTYANALRRRRARPGDKWHLDEVFITINGKRHYLWRAVDQHGDVLDILVTSRRDTRAATRFFRKLLTGLEYVPRVLVTDKLGSYGAARRRVLRSVEHRQSVVSSGGSDTRLDLGPSRGLNIELTAGRPRAARCAGQLTSPRPRSSRVSLPPFELKPFGRAGCTTTGDDHAPQ